MNLTLAEAAIGAGAVLEAPASVANAGALMVTGYSIDSRTVGAGELFFAVRGERLDGHDFVAAALRTRRRCGSRFARARRFLPDAVLAAPLLIAEDPLIACRRWPRMCAANGASAWWPSPARPAKTTTKEAVAAALGAKFNVLKSQGQSQQRLRPASAVAAPGAGARDRRRRDGHESRR
jgi:UDP-N-acetylmuramoyl-tripeptide--D-alanyl-D-alanine ligase